MVEGRQTGILKVWKSDRGFGFIQPEDGSQDIFLHITAIRKAVRDPKVGDTILYNPSLQADGRLRAVNATIQGVELQPDSRQGQMTRRSNPPTRKAGTPVLNNKHRKQTSNVLASFAFAAVGFVFLGLAVLPALKTLTGHAGTVTTVDDVTPKITAAIDPNCDIKGNISWNSGRKYYHMPGMEDYAITEIDAERGERWFCSETEAQAAGWRRAPTP